MTEEAVMRLASGLGAQELTETRQPLIEQFPHVIRDADGCIPVPRDRACSAIIAADLASR